MSNYFLFPKQLPPLFFYKYLHYHALLLPHSYSHKNHPLYVAQVGLTLLQLPYLTKDF